MKKLDKKTKGEQLFFLLLMFALLMGALCVAGCGGQSCETPKFGSEEGEDFKAVGCSVPGCGGCISSGKGCNTVLWPQSCKISNGTYSGGGTEGEGCITSVDTRYYGDGCLGCGQMQKSCYVGFVNWDIEGTKVKGALYGTSDGEEHLAGCYNGCAGCVGTGNMFGKYIYELEKYEGID